MRGGVGRDPGVLDARPSQQLRRPAIGETTTERVEDLRSALDEAAIDTEISAELLRAGEEKRLVLVPEARA